jgi:hypothetical protein
MGETLRREILGDERVWMEWEEMGGFCGRLLFWIGM